MLPGASPEMDAVTSKIQPFAIMKIPSLVPSNFPWLLTRFSFLLAIPFLLGLLSVPTLPAAALVIPHKAASGLQLLSVVSRKTQGPAGTFDINLPLSGPPGIECRSGGTNGNHTLVFTFNNVLASATVTATPGSGNVALPLIFNGSTMKVNLTNVINAQVITITVSNATDDTGQVLPNTDVRMGVLMGDVGGAPLYRDVRRGEQVGDATGDGLVNSSDIAFIKAHTGELISAANFTADINGNGIISATDVAIAKSRSGTGLPGVSIVPGPGTQSLSFTGPSTIDLGQTTTLTFSVDLTFSGPNSAYGLSYWMEANDALEPYIQISNVTYDIFPDPNQTTPSPAPFIWTNGTTSGFMTENRDLGATVNDFQNPVAPGTYHVGNLTFCLASDTPPGTYTLRWTTVGPRFSEVTDTNFDSNPVTPAGTFTFTVTGSSMLPPPLCGTISGTITDPNGAPVVGALVQACRADPVYVCQGTNYLCSSIATTNSVGFYQITDAPTNNTPLTLTVHPPSSSSLLPGYLFPASVSSCSGSITGKDVMLQAPVPPGTETTVQPHYGGGGVIPPSVYSTQSLTLTTTGCPGGMASYSIFIGSTVGTGSMMETPANSGTYTASVPPLSPAHGAATVTITILCPSPTTKTFIYLH